MNYTHKHLTAGFTLIELLVVVLIIGILASVALPQYRVAVEKSRMVQQITLVNSIVKAQELYFLANGTFADDLSNLDIEYPKGCSLLGGGDKTWVGCGKYSINYAHGSGSNVHGSNGARWNEGTLFYERIMNVGPRAGEAVKTFCHAKTDDKVANQVCKSMGGTNPRNSALFGAGYTQYNLQ